MHLGEVSWGGWATAVATSPVAVTTKTMEKVFTVGAQVQHHQTTNQSSLQAVVQSRQQVLITAVFGRALAASPNVRPATSPFPLAPTSGMVLADVCARVCVCVCVCVCEATSVKTDCFGSPKKKCTTKTCLNGTPSPKVLTPRITKYVQESSHHCHPHHRSPNGQLLSRA